MLYIKAPYYVQPGEIREWRKTIFLGGSLTGAEDWQKETADKFIDEGFYVFNPRRASFDANDKNAEREQITWEHQYLGLCEILLFYFSHETVAPITLLELGASLEKAKLEQYKKIYIAIDPEYQRKNDVVIQTELRNPKFAKNISYDLGETVQRIIKENK